MQASYGTSTTNGIVGYLPSGDDVNIGNTADGLKIIKAKSLYLSLLNQCNDKVLLQLRC